MGAFSANQLASQEMSRITTRTDKTGRENMRFKQEKKAKHLAGVHFSIILALSSEASAE